MVEADQHCQLSLARVYLVEETVGQQQEILIVEGVV